MTNLNPRMHLAGYPSGNAASGSAGGTATTSSANTAPPTTAVTSYEAFLQQQQQQQQQAAAPSTGGPSPGPATIVFVNNGPHPGGAYTSTTLAHPYHHAAAASEAYYRHHAAVAAAGMPVLHHHHHALHYFHPHALAHSVSAPPPHSAAGVSSSTNASGSRLELPKKTSATGSSSPTPGALNGTSGLTTSTSNQSQAQYRSGRWSLDEKILFLYGLQKFGKGRWKKISIYLPHRSLVQIKSHAQKVLKRQDDGEDIFRRLEENHLRCQQLIAKVHERIGGEPPSLLPRPALPNDSTTTAAALAAAVSHGNFPVNANPVFSGIHRIERPSGGISNASMTRVRDETSEEKKVDGTEDFIAASALCQLFSIPGSETPATDGEFTKPGAKDLAKSREEKKTEEPGETDENNAKLVDEGTATEAAA